MKRLPVIILLLLLAIGVWGSFLAKPFFLLEKAKKLKTRIDVETFAQENELRLTEVQSHLAITIRTIHLPLFEKYHQLHYLVDEKGGVELEQVITFVETL